MADAIIRAEGVTKRFFRKGRESARYFDAVHELDLGIAPGEFVMLMGRSGCGKSTLLNMLAGLLAPTEGKVLLAGEDLYALPDAALSELRNRRIGVVPQGQTPLHSLTVVQNVTLPSLLNQPDVDAEQRALDVLDRLGIRDLADSYPSELSGGELRRMSIARALACTPDVVLADEPTSDLDDENTQVALQVLRDAADAGAAVLVATHDQAVAPFATRVMRMDGGCIKQDSPVLCIE